MSFQNINTFCNLINEQKISESEQAFKKLSPQVQALFIYYAWQILSNGENYSGNSYLTAFLLFKLFRNQKEIKNLNQLRKFRNLEAYYQQALEWANQNKLLIPVRPKPVPKTKLSIPVPKSKTKLSIPKTKTKSVPRTNKKFDKQYQRYDSPESETEPLYVYYTSLYSENPNSRLAITWLTEHGIFDDTKRKEIEMKYKKLADNNLLLK